MAYIGNILQKSLADLKADRLNFLSDASELSGLRDTFDLAGGETKCHASPVDHFGVTLTTNTTDNNNYGHILTLNLGSVA